MHYHHESGNSQTKKLPVAETVTFLSDAKDMEKQDKIDQYYSKSDDVFDDYYSSHNVQEQ
jgi:hypothetical protein